MILEREEARDGRRGWGEERERERVRERERERNIDVKEKLQLVAPIMAQQMNLQPKYTP